MKRNSKKLYALFATLSVVFSMVFSVCFSGNAYCENHNEVEATWQEISAGYQGDGCSCWLFSATNVINYYKNKTKDNTLIKGRNNVFSNYMKTCPETAKKYLGRTGTDAQMCEYLNACGIDTKIESYLDMIEENLNKRIAMFAQLRNSISPLKTHRPIFDSSKVNVLADKRDAKDRKAVIAEQQCKSLELLKTHFLITDASPVSVLINGNHEITVVDMDKDDFFCVVDSMKNSSQIYWIRGKDLVSRMVHTEMFNDGFTIIQTEMIFNSR